MAFDFNSIEEHSNESIDRAAEYELFNKQISACTYRKKGKIEVGEVCYPQFDHNGVIDDFVVEKLLSKDESVNDAMQLPGAFPTQLVYAVFRHLHIDCDAPLMLKRPIVAEDGRELTHPRGGGEYELDYQIHLNDCAEFLGLYTAEEAADGKYKLKEFRDHMLLEPPTEADVERRRYETLNKMK